MSEYLELGLTLADRRWWLLWLKHRVIVQCVRHYGRRWEYDTTVTD